jgi:hypothetical protein
VIHAQPSDENGPHYSTTTDGTGYFLFPEVEAGKWWTLWEEMQEGWAPVTSPQFQVYVEGGSDCVRVRFKNRQATPTPIATPTETPLPAPTPTPTATPTLSHQSPNVGTFEPSGGSGRVGEWTEFTTTYSDPNGYEDITWAFFFLDREPPMTSGGLAAVYIEQWDLLWLKGGGICQLGQAKPLITDYVTLDCRDTSVSGEGDTLTINWHVRPERCFDDGCDWNRAYEYVIDRTGLWDAGDVGWWTLYPASGAGRDRGPVTRVTKADLERLIEEVEAWRSLPGVPYLPLIQR